MVKEETISRYKKYIGKNFGCIYVDDIEMGLELSFFLGQIEKIYNNLKTIKSSTTISKESTSKTFVDGNGVHLSHK